MPLTRYQARNEYGLADPDLYQAADKDDPEALLEGVAMAGLVGILRQLGDLAEFAAVMFHDLHDEVMATASRSHVLMARVQQLEAEVPFVENALLCQTDHSPFFSDKGLEWHPNLQLEQCVITRGDLPRCVMDSYEECRGPPRLFLLDKFDISGAGACLKRYSDPSFVKLETSSYEASWDDIQTEKKSQKAKRRASHWRNVRTPENALSSHAKLHELFLEEHLEGHHSDPARVVKLKTRKLDGYSLISKSGESYMEKFVQTCVDNKTGYQIITPNPELLTWNVDTARDVVTDIPEISMVGTVEKSHKGSRTEVSLPNEHENVAKINLIGSVIEKDIETVPESTHSEVPGTIIKDSHAYLNGKPELLQHRSYSEDLTSEADNYVDASATMESETETDNECRRKYRSGALKDGYHHTDSDVDEERMVDPSQFSFFHSTGNTPVSENGQSTFGKQSNSYSYTDTASISIDDQSDGEKFSGCLPSASSFKNELVDSTSHLTPEAKEVSQDINVQESVINRKVDGKTSFSSNNTCSTTRPISHNAESCLLTVHSLPSEVVETSPEIVRLDLIKGGGNDGSKVDPIDSSISCESFDVKNSKFPSETSSICSTSDGSRCDTTIEKNYMADYSSNLVNSGTSYVFVANNDIETNSTVACDGSSLTGKLLPCSAGMGMDGMPSKVCGPSIVDETNLKDTLDDEIYCITVANAVADVDSRNSVDVDSQSSVAEIANEHSCTFGTTADVSISESHEDTLQNGMSMPTEVDSKLTSDFNSGEKLAEASPTCDKCHEHLSDECFHDLPGLDNAATYISPKIELAVSDSHAETSGGDIYHTACLSCTSLIGSLPWISTSTYRSSSEAAEICHDTVVESDGTLNNPESAKKNQKSPLEVSSEGLGTALDSNDLASCQSLSPMTSLDQSDRDAETKFPCKTILVDSSVDSSPVNNMNLLESVTIDQSDQVQTPCASDAFADEELMQSSVSGVLELVPQSVGLEFVPQPAGVELNSPKQEMDLDPIVPSFGLIPETSPPNQDDMPPLPPLPPMQWRIGKIPHSFFPTFMGGSVETRSSDVHIEYKPPEQSVPLGSERSEQLPGEFMNNASEKLLQSSIQFPTIGTDLNSQYDSFGSQRTQSSNASAKLPEMPSQGNVEDFGYEENNLLAAHAAQNHELVYSQEPSLKLPQDPPAKDNTDVHISQSSRDYLHFPETKTLMPAQSTKEEVKGHSVNDWNAETAEPSSSSVQKIPEGDAMWPVSAFTVAPTLDTNKLEEVHMVRLPRPRSPLVDAVSAHDRRTMKKVSERIQPPIKQKQDDKDSLLEQIRNKSISLKPTVATRPSIQAGPKTNLRVAAILEKANTIRQAMAGSDEDEDSDSWSDS